MIWVLAAGSFFKVCCNGHAAQQFVHHQRVHVVEMSELNLGALRWLGITHAVRELQNLGYVYRRMTIVPQIDRIRRMCFSMRSDLASSLISQFVMNIS